jgi:hypothetical protein
MVHTVAASTIRAAWFTDTDLRFIADPKVRLVRRQGLMGDATVSLRAPNPVTLEA